MLSSFYGRLFSKVFDLKDALRSCDRVSIEFYSLSRLLSIDASLLARLCLRIFSTLPNDCTPSGPSFSPILPPDEDLLEAGLVTLRFGVLRSGL